MVGCTWGSSWSCPQTVLVWWCLWAMLQRLHNMRSYKKTETQMWVSGKSPPTLTRYLPKHRIFRLPAKPNINIQFDFCVGPSNCRVFLCCRETAMQEFKDKAGTDLSLYYYQQIPWRDQKQQWIYPTAKCHLCSKSLTCLSDIFCHNSEHDQSRLLFSAVQTWKDNSEHKHRGWKGDFDSESETHYFPQARSAIYPSRFFWSELQSFEDIGCRDVCLGWAVMFAPLC